MKALKLLSVTAVALAVIIAVAGGLIFFRPWVQELPIETEVETSNTQIITAIERQEQIVLLSASAQGIYEEKAHRTVFGKRLPGSGRAEYLQYTYRAKLGLEGADVEIEQIGENHFLISIPEFIVIGKDDMEFDTVVEKNGLLSVVTENIDTAENITEILSGDALEEQLLENRDLLEAQATAFYTGIIRGIDDAVELEFEFQP